MGQPPEQFTAGERLGLYKNSGRTNNLNQNPFDQEEGVEA